MKEKIRISSFQNYSTPMSNKKIFMFKNEQTSASHLRESNLGRNGDEYVSLQDMVDNKNLNSIHFKDYFQHKMKFQVGENRQN